MTGLMRLARATMKTERMAKLEEPNSRKIPTKTIFTFAVAPLIFLAWFYLYVLRQRFHLGYWPTPSHPDPKEAGYFGHHLSIFIGLGLAPLLSVAAVRSASFRSSKYSKFPTKRAMAFVAISMTAYIGDIQLDPGQFRMCWD